MARKQQTADEGTTATATPPATNGHESSRAPAALPENQSEAFKIIAGKLGPDCKPQAVLDEYQRQTGRSPSASALQLARKAIKKVHGGSVKQGPPSSGRVDLSAADLVSISKLSTEYGGLGKLADEVHKIEKIARAVGGLDQLYEGIEYLRTIHQDMRQ